jgi:hypothetical protein
MVIEKLLISLKEPMKLLRVFKALGFEQETEAKETRLIRSSPSPEACQHHELRNTLRENPPSSGPVRISANPDSVKS